MSFANKIKGMFFEVPEDEKAEEPVVEKESNSTPEPVTTNTALPEVSSEVPQDIKGETNQDIFKSLSDALEEANMEGFDYFEFGQVLEKFKDKMPSEESRFQAAFTSGSVMGATKKKLLASAQHYLAVLNAEAEKFSAFYKDQYKKVVTDKEESLNGIDEAIAQKRSQIELLEQEINDLTKSKSAVNAEIFENKGKAEKAKNDFITTLNVFLNRINSDVEKIEKYIVE